MKRHKEGNFKFNWTIGIAPSPIARGVCRRCFELCYSSSPTYIDNLIISIKNGQRNCEVEFKDKSPSPLTDNKKHWLKVLTQFADAVGISISQKQLAAMQVPNTEASLNCFAWMNSFFYAVGDKEPDRVEIHLDAQPIRQIHKEYKEMCEYASQVMIYNNYFNIFMT